MRAIVTALMLLAAGCTYPSERVDTVPEEPAIIVIGAPEGAILRVDGLDMGPAAQYDGKQKALIIQPGTHVVTVESGGSERFREKIFVTGSDIRTIRVQ